MKLQINGQQWRLRISESELQHLREGESLISTSLLPDDATFRFQLQLVPVSQASMQREDSGWKFSIPAAPVDAYVQRLPCRDGLNFVLPVDAANVTFELAFEVDVRDSARQRGAGAHRHSA
ncbi:MAG: hypothetical protein ACTS5I_04540 [Rhodanobacter sp.]